MSHFFTQIMRYVDRMSMQEWFWVLVVAIIVGVVCLRGFGSRSQY